MTGELTEMIRLWEPVERRRTFIPRHQYVLIKDAMLATIGENQIITLHNLIHELTVKLGSVVRGNLPWYILKVKSDLAERQLIVVETSVGPHRDQLIQLKPGRKRRNAVSYPESFIRK